MAEWTARAAEQGADLICFPELAITGYPPEDLVLRPRFVEDNLAALDALAVATAGSSCAVMVGFVDRSEQGLHNAAALIRDGRVQERYHKIQLPNFGVFDEKRYFVPGDAACSVRLATSELGLSVCEDAWHGDAPFDEYERTRPHVDPEHQRLAVSPRQGRGTTGDLPRSRTADRRMDRLRERGRRPGRAGVRRWIDGRVSRWRGGRARLDVRGGPGRREDRRRRRARSSEHPTTVAHGSGGGLPGARARHQGLRAEERVPRGGDRHVGRDRLGARRHARRRRARSGSRARARDAVPVLLARERRGRGGVRSPLGRPDRHGADHGRVRRVPAHARRPVRGNRGGRRRGEPAGSHPREPAHGALQQVRLARAGDREQERIRGGLRHPLRRHGGGVRSHQGRPEDVGVRDLLPGGTSWIPRRRRSPTRS